MTPADRQTLLAAAALLDEDARCLSACHTIRGEWPAYEQNAKTAYDRTVHLAGELRRIAAAEAGPNFLDQALNEGDGTYRP